MTQTSNSDTC